MDEETRKQLLKSLLHHHIKHAKDHISEATKIVNGLKQDLIPEQCFCKNPMRSILDPVTENPFENRCIRCGGKLGI